MEVYAAISAVQAELAKIGISKDKKNVQQGYSFRGIDDIYDVLSPILAKNKLCILPRVLTRTCTERQSQRGGILFYTIVECEFDLVSAVDGSKHVIRTFGEAMDSADKSTNKAMSAAYKYAAFQTFCIPVDVEDADATTPQVKPTHPPPQDAPQAAQEDVPDFLPPEDEKPKITPSQKKLEALLNEAGIDREDFKRWLYSIEYLNKNAEGKLSMKDVKPNHLKALLDKWDGAKSKFSLWQDGKNQKSK